MSKFEKFCVFMTWFCMTGGLICNIICVLQHDHQPSHLLVFLLYAFCFLSYGEYTTRRIHDLKGK